ncbi:demethylmenaquinone methyltransferase [Parasporobacterium paucivorans]|uniref:Demethylmenaquinone methyltransferase n=1 Tax=Parasporobacterium paucivorans DSM 15970 TaxID=1122934 RepID=A0A1M6DI32_9FIRM|nr:demethylmenaquinone methyltransferase [Parasporobacterium paucivorans]SHI72842.1 demethylmenaquinone methyltransferase / 2-methoxy-6-polyprenyl-1,4-benzoquinol methylase [Parasporobacterium paucivorans DSM 15970]
MKKETKVHKIFENISSRYDIMNDIISFGMHRLWKLRLISEVTRQNPEKILDVCCGTGDISLLAARMNPNASIYGLDFSENMLKIANRRKKEADRKNTHSVRFQKGDAMNLPFEDGFFDAAVISFGLRNVSDYGRVIREMTRVVRPGGRVYCLDSSYPESSRIRPLFGLYFKSIMPFLGWIIAGSRNEYKWLNESTERFVSKGRLCKIFSQSGLSDTGCYSHLFGVAACHRGTKT